MPFLDRVEKWFIHFEWRIVTGLVIVLALRLGISPLPSSFWLDETGGWWASGGSFANWVEAMKTTQFPQSPLYTLILWIVAQITGFHEALLRLPSVAAVTVAAVLLYRIVVTLFGPLLAIYAVLLWVSLGNVGFAAADARPYGIGLLAVVLTAYTFLRWLQTGKTYLVVGNGIAAAMAIYCSYYFGAIFVAQAVFVLIGHRRQWLRMRPALLISPILAAILLIPVIPTVLAVARETYRHVSVEIPSWTDLGIAWMPPRWVVAAVVATGIMALLRPGKVQFIAPLTEPSSPLSRPPALYWLALLAVTPALLLFLFSQITRTSVFVPRYFLSMTPGLAVLGAFAVHCCQPPMWRGSFAAVLFTISMLASGTRLWTKHQVEDWRGASAMLTQIRQAEPGVMILAGGQFVDSRFLAFPVDAVQRRWLLAPQNAYPIPGRLELLPLAVGPASEDEVRKVLNKAAEQDHFFIVLPPASPITQWAFGRFLEEYRSVVLHADPLVVRFERRVRR